MAKLDEVLKLVRLYEEKYRHPSLTRFSVSNKYDLFPGKENMENCRVRSPYWSTSPKYIAAIAVPFDSAFECAALEEFLLANVQTTDNSIFQR